MIRFFVLKVEHLADFALLFQQGKIRQISGLSSAFSVPPCLCGLVLLPLPGFVVRGAIYFLAATKNTKKHEKEHLNHRGHRDTEKKEEHGDFAYFIQPKRPNEIRKMPFWRQGNYSIILFLGSN